MPKAAITERKLQFLAKKMLATLNQRNATLDIFLLPHAEIKALKMKLFKKGNKVRLQEPNVLSIPEPKTFPHPERKAKYLGEVYLNKDILKKSPERAAPLLLHGILHLLGYDHIKKFDAVKMELFEAKILERLVSR